MASESAVVLQRGGYGSGDGNEGFDIVLSSHVPDIIGGNIRQLLNGVLVA